MAQQLFALSDDIDIAALARRFAQTGRVQVPDVLTQESARNLRALLATKTEWGLATKAGEETAIQTLHPKRPQPGDRQKLADIYAATEDAAKRGDYAFRYAFYPILDAFNEGWDRGGPHDILLEHINADPMMELVRALTGFSGLTKADAQATLYAPGHFLGVHSDSHVEEGWRVAYVLNMTVDEWRPEWGGYLAFLDAGGDIEEAFLPRFNTLNLLRVPQSHMVTQIPSFAPVGRHAVTGWFRDR